MAGHSAGCGQVHLLPLRPLSWHAARAARRPFSLVFRTCTRFMMGSSQTVGVWHSSSTSRSLL